AGLWVTLTSSMVPLAAVTVMGVSGLTSDSPSAGTMVSSTVGESLLTPLASSPPEPEHATVKRRLTAANPTPRLRAVGNALPSTRATSSQCLFSSDKHGFAVIGRAARPKSSGKKAKRALGACHVFDTHLARNQKDTERAAPGQAGAALRPVPGSASAGTRPGSTRRPSR